MNKQSLLNALVGVLNSTSIPRTGVQEPSTSDSTSLHATPTNVTLSATGVSNCTQACALGGLVCVVALPNEANFWYVALVRYLKAHYIPHNVRRSLTVA
ncbi:hypothetical protein BDV33DRAFT_175076 [Aspergillus novoparasiticus]|uniref:Uncharacterized protein n=1 Tax=Aspergillus novoparasiticus TaxID=986946 RepID=A0A5N6EN23_9EURO|nr:hypothetical protein BDV33DRAFT_175076 [Aspergillus novoparasiticus]